VETAIRPNRGEDQEANNGRKKLVKISGGFENVLVMSEQGKTDPLKKEIQLLNRLLVFQGCFEF
jgi:hypothetical protein